ncbi:hypothetical protein [Teredinibacter sp. KSP-S5-2]|uniref:hypothetical protein n=1 Tax=Teredinibacter sp. KSP-S5-2 TaxID=3034506 RepID=UPI0029350778|nr:hypothetical protein [Teredinibacter sp. KSP-S5-2]WNO09767.1 hypothetical protein P5V12_01085 [Teredinibacter sp. KSP-S5-2]
MGYKVSERKSLANTCLFLVLLVFSCKALACRCGTLIDEAKIAESTDVILIKVESLQLGEYSDGERSYPGLEVGYQVVRRFWGAERKPKLIELLDSCKVGFYPNREYIVAILRKGRFGIDNVISQCSGVDWVSKSNRREKTILTEEMVNKYIENNSD